MKIPTLLGLWLALAAFCGGPFAARAQSTAFHYQGALVLNGNPVSGTNRVSFTLYDAATAGAQVGPSLTNQLVIFGGLVNTELDFGLAPLALKGTNLWLEIAVEGDPWEILTPRQRLLAVPFATVAQCVVSNGLAPGAYTSALTLNNPANQFTGSYSGGGAGLSNVNALTLGGLSANDFWKLGGNAGTTPGLDYLGTADNKAVELKVNGQRALRLEPHASSPNVIAGSPANVVTAGVRGATISGGGTPNDYSGQNLPNLVLSGAHYGTVGGGLGNTNVSESGTIAGGQGNIVFNPFATVGGGYGNSAGETRSTVAGGALNAALGYANTVAGGERNTTRNSHATVGGGRDNAATNQFSVVSGGLQNVASGVVSTVAGGQGNAASDSYTTVGGGFGNSASVDYATVSGGLGNTASGAEATVGGGDGNTASGLNSTIGGGLANSASQNHATVGGGHGNAALADGATVGGGIHNSNRSLNSIIAGGQLNFLGINSSSCSILGGYRNTIPLGAGGSTIGGGQNNQIGLSADNSLIAGGSENVISDNASYSTIGGGTGNQIAQNADYATVPGGFACAAQGDYSFAAGRRAVAGHNGCFVWADSQDAGFFSTTANEASFRCRGGARFVSATDGSGNPTAGVMLAPGGGAWSTLSDRHAKKNFAPANPLDILDKVAALPMSTWNYNSQDDSIRHLGPMAQDFHAAFGVGENDRTISTVDADGVALAAIQGLNQKLTRAVERKDAENAELKARLAELEKIVARLAAGQTGKE